jgi:hypothetical protein
VAGWGEGGGEIRRRRRRKRERGSSSDENKLSGLSTFCEKE